MDKLHHFYEVYGKLQYIYCDHKTMNDMRRITVSMYYRGYTVYNETAKDYLITELNSYRIKLMYRTDEKIIKILYYNYHKCIFLLNTIFKEECTT